MIPAEPAPDSRRIEVLDGWRIISVSLVILSHILLYSTIKIDNSGNSELNQIIHLVANGAGFQGVYIFFVISGFVICRGFIFEFYARKSISLLAFYVRRFMRIVPPLLMFFAIVAILHLFGVIQTNKHFLRVLTFTCNFPGADCGGFYGSHTWSLSVEEQFYLVIPILFSIFASLKNYTMNAIIISFLALTAILPFFSNSPILSMISGFIYIAFGVAWALNESRVRRIVAAFPAWSVYLLLLLMPLLAWAGQTRHWPLVPAIQATVITLLLCLTIQKASRFKDFLLLPAMQKLGRASYGIYLWQQLATNYYSGAGYTFYTLAILAVAVWSLISYEYLERPLIRLGARLSDRIKANSSKAHPGAA